MAKKTFMTVAAKPPFRDMSGAFTKAHRELLKDAQKGMRRQGSRLRDLTVEEAPKDTGKFASNIRFRTFVRPNEVGVRITGPEPLWTFITEGTKPHVIKAKNAAALRFYWEKGPEGPKVYFFKQVDHPGTKANRFHGRAFRRWLPGARSFLQTISRDYTRTLGDEIKRMQA